MDRVIGAEGERRPPFPAQAGPGAAVRERAGGAFVAHLRYIRGAATVRRCRPPPEAIDQTFVLSRSLG